MEKYGQHVDSDIATEALLAREIWLDYIILGRAVLPPKLWNKTENTPQSFPIFNYSFSFYYININWRICTSSPVKKA